MASDLNSLLKFLSDFDINTKSHPTEASTHGVSGDWLKQAQSFSSQLKRCESAINDLKAGEICQLIDFAQLKKPQNVETLILETTKVLSKTRWDKSHETSLNRLLESTHLTKVELLGFTLYAFSRKLFLASADALKVLIASLDTEDLHNCRQVFTLIIKEIDSLFSLDKRSSTSHRDFRSISIWMKLITGALRILSREDLIQLDQKTQGSKLLKKIDEARKNLSAKQLILPSTNIHSTNNERAKIRVIAFYLPQYHPIPENDAKWGKGFTEWTNTSKAKPLFTGHHQPNIPRDLGYYDLRLEESRLAQADLARTYGIEGFCYWHYWLGNGKRLLETPFNAVLKTKKPDFPFCLGWANHDWQGVFFGSTEVHIKQSYPGREDHIDHFNFLAKAFADKRYIRVDNKPLLYIYKPSDIPSPKDFVALWKNMAVDYGFDGLYLVGEGLDEKKMNEYGYDATSYSYHRKIGSVFEQWLEDELRLERETRKPPEGLKIFPYSLAMKYFLKPGPSAIRDIPQIYPNWDSTPRLGEEGVAIYDSSPELFRLHVREAVEKIIHKPESHRILFAKSWNEWAEGNYLEPDLNHGLGYLEALRSEIANKIKCSAN